MHVINELINFGDHGRLQRELSGCLVGKECARNSCKLEDLLISTAHNAYLFISNSVVAAMG